MLEKFKDIISFRGTPVGAFVAMLVIDGILHPMQAYTLSYVICGILFIVMLLSTIKNFSFYGKFMKYTCVIVCAITALFMITEAPDMGDWCRKKLGCQKPELTENASLQTNSARFPALNGKCARMKPVTKIDISGKAK